MLILKWSDNRIHNIFFREISTLKIIHNNIKNVFQFVHFISHLTMAMMMTFMSLKAYFLTFPISFLSSLTHWLFIGYYMTNYCLICNTNSRKGHWHGKWWFFVGIFLLSLYFLCFWRKKNMLNNFFSMINAHKSKSLISNLHILII